MDTAQTTDKASWWERLTERCYTTSTATLTRRVKQEAGAAYDALIHDLERPLEPHFEQEVAKQLAAGQATHFRPANTLMPVMMQRFGLKESALLKNALLHHADLDKLRDTCNACTAAGDCWKAMRTRTELKKHRQRCPNANAFDALAARQRQVILKMG